MEVVPLAPSPSDATTQRWIATATTEKSGVDAEISRLNGVISSAQSDLASQQNTAAELQRLRSDLSPPPDPTALRYVQGVESELAAVNVQIGNTQSAIATAQASLAVYQARQSQLQALLVDMGNP